MYTVQLQLQPGTLTLTRRQTIDSEGAGIMWTALVVTCPAHTWVAPLERELARMLALGPPDHRADTVLLYNYIYIYVIKNIFFK